MQKSEKHRVQFDFSPGALVRLDELVTLTDAASRAEVVRRALALLDKVIAAQKHGDELVLRQPNGDEERLMVLV